MVVIAHTRSGRHTLEHPVTFLTLGADFAHVGRFVGFGVLVAGGTVHLNLVFVRIPLRYPKIQI